MASPAYRYAEDVLSDKIVACQSIKQAAQRFLGDLKAAEKPGARWRFDLDLGLRPVRFTEQFLAPATGNYDLVAYAATADEGIRVSAFKRVLCEGTVNDKTLFDNGMKVFTTVTNEKYLNSSFKNDVFIENFLFKHQFHSDFFSNWFFLNHFNNILNISIFN